MFNHVLFNLAELPLEIQEDPCNMPAGFWMFLPIRQNRETRLSPTATSLSSSKRVIWHKSATSVFEAIWAPCCNKHAINPELVHPICHTLQSDEDSVCTLGSGLEKRGERVNATVHTRLPGNIRASVPHLLDTRVIIPAPAISRDSAREDTTMNNLNKWQNPSRVGEDGLRGGITRFQQNMMDLDCCRI